MAKNDTRLRSSAEINWMTSVVTTGTLAAAWAFSRAARRREQALRKQLRDEHDLLQTVIDALPDSIVWKDTQSNVRGMNQALRDRLATYDVQATDNGRISEHEMAEEVAAYVLAVEQLEQEVVDTGKAVIGRQMSRPEADGSTSVVLRTAVPLLKDGDIVGVLSTTRNITEAVQLERSLADASRLESIGQLSAGVAHEINTPVQFVSDNTAFLQTSFSTLVDAIGSLSEVADMQDAESVAMIKKQADLEFLLEDIPDAIDQSRDGLKQIAQIVQAMKAFAHPGGEVGPTDINSLITSTVEVSRNEWKYNADLELRLDEDLPQPHCDGGQIKQVILNLIVNGAHAIADAGNEKGTITVATSGNEHWVTLSISDTGTGIAPEIQERMFERFFTTKGVGRGSGQGLAIAYDAVTSHGGHIEVDSTVGEGTTFRIVIPIRQPEEASANVE